MAGEAGMYEKKGCNGMDFTKKKQWHRELQLDAFISGYRRSKKSGKSGIPIKDCPAWEVDREIPVVSRYHTRCTGSDRCMRDRKASLHRRRGKTR